MELETLHSSLLLPSNKHILIASAAQSSAVHQRGAAISQKLLEHLRYFLKQLDEILIRDLQEVVMESAMIQMLSYEQLGIQLHIAKGSICLDDLIGFIGGILLRIDLEFWPSPAGLVKGLAQLLRDNPYLFVNGLGREMLKDLVISLPVRRLQLFHA